MFAADVDKDGVSDVEEVTEYGTDPFLADISGIVAAAEVRVASLPPMFTLEGQRLLMTGYAPRQAGAVEFRLEDMKTSEPLSVLLLRTDERGVFSGLWNLSDVCNKGEGPFRIMVQERARHEMRLHCGEGEILRDLTFAGIPWQAGETPRLLSGDEAILQAKGKPGLRVFAAYASVVFAKDLFADNNDMLRVSPWKPLTAGPHTLSVMPHDPINRIIYEPIKIPFVVEDGFGEQLKSTVYYAPGGIAIILLVFVGSIVYIRRLRSMRQGISLVGEEYPDEY